jgi:hypothetical protein
MNRELLQQAVEVLENADYVVDMGDSYFSLDPSETTNLILALRQELAKPEQEPVEYDGPALYKAKAEREHPLDKKADNARELGLDYEPLGTETDNARDIRQGNMYNNQQNICTSPERKICTY